MAENEVQKGDQVTWNWGSGKPGGEVAEVAKEGEIAIESKKGNTIKKNAEPENPAVHIAREGNDVVKKASELTVEDKTNGTETKDEEKKDEKKDEHANGVSEEKPADKADDKPAGKETEAKENDSKTGEKRKADAVENGDETGAKESEEPAAKHQKTDEGPKKPKGRGRPAKGTTTEKKEPVKKRAPKKAATESGEPRRSGRNKS